MNNLRIGQGWDRHRLEPGNGLILGGISVQSELGCVAHSDGDVLIHALIDALLGATALGDIGSHFPPSDPEFKNIESVLLLKKVLQLIKSRNYCILNIDSTIILEAPKLRPHIDRMRENLSAILDLGKDQISIKAKTAEKCDSAGRGEAIESQAIVLLVKSCDQEASPYLGTVVHR